MATMRHEVPQDALAQRMAHLRAANVVRVERARFRRQLTRLERHQAERMVAALVARPPAWAGTWRCGDMLCCCIPKRGEVWVSKLLRRCRITETRRLAALTDRQRRELVELLER